MLLPSHGRSQNAADITASDVHININQQVVVLISVPDGKRIKLTNSNPVNGLDDDTGELNENTSNKNGGQEYQMTSFGLTPIEKIKKLQNFYPDDSVNKVR